MHTDLDVDVPTASAPAFLAGTPATGAFAAPRRADCTANRPFDGVQGGVRRADPDGAGSDEGEEGRRDIQWTAEQGHVAAGHHHGLDVYASGEFGAGAGEGDVLGPEYI